MPKKEEPPTVLIPVLSKQEDNADFLETATRKFPRAIVLAVIDKADWVGQFGFVVGEIRNATQLVEKIKKSLEEKGKKTEDIVEWGNTCQKIVQLAEIRNCGKIALVQQENQHFQKLVKELEEKTQKRLEIIPLTPPAAQE